MNLDAKVSALIAKSESPGADSAPDAKDGAPPTGQASGVESAPGAPAASTPATPSPDAPGATDAPSMADLMAAKLARITEQRRAARVLDRARAQQGEAARLAAEAKASREAAAKEEERWKNLRTGNILETIKAAGRDPKEVFEQMTKEALEAGTPEAQMRRMREEMDRQLAELVEPLKKTVAELQSEKEQAQAEARERGRLNDFNRHATAEEYESLRDEYTPERLYGYVKALIESPEEFWRHQERLQVPLTDPAKGYNMKDILNVLKSVQDEHAEGIQKRRASRTASSQSTAASDAAPSLTVNGTAERRNAGTTTIGNDLATARAADGKFIPKGATAAQRVRERARRLGGG